MEGGYGESRDILTQAKMANMPTIPERIAASIKHAEDKLARTKRAKELFDKNPDLQELLEIMQQGIF